MRPYWKGYLKLALVSCPIALHAACSTAERIAFRQINKATGNRLRQQLIDEETREPVDPEHKGRGYEVAKGQYREARPDRTRQGRPTLRTTDSKAMAATMSAPGVREDAFFDRGPGGIRQHVEECQQIDVVALLHQSVDVLMMLIQHHAVFSVEAHRSSSTNIISGAREGPLCGLTFGLCVRKRPKRVGAIH
jgi:Ku70/Ku80 beta-barrel domain